MRVKNNTGSSKIWAGQEIAAGDYYTIQASELINWQSNDTVLTDIAANNLIVNDGVSDLTTATGLKLLLGQIVEVSKQAEPQPFAVPAYRTKRAATATVLSVDPNSDADIQYQLTSERYVSGGCLLVENAEIGDYVMAEVEDLDGVIPAPYRAALCEAWPIVSTYIEKEFVKVVKNGVSIHEINTYPLNAKITPGLYLCLHYYAVNAGTARKVAINYYLTKKL